MNVSGSLTNFNVRSSIESNAGERGQQSRNRENSNTQSQSSSPETFSVSNNARIRIIQVAKDGVRIDELSNRAENRNINSVSRNLPQNQYVNNQFLIEDDALSRQIGVDLYV